MSIEDVVKQSLKMYVQEMRLERFSGTVQCVKSLLLRLSDDYINFILKTFRSHLQKELKLIKTPNAIIIS